MTSPGNPVGVSSGQKRRGILGGGTFKAFLWFRVNNHNYHGVYVCVCACMVIVCRQTCVHVYNRRKPCVSFLRTPPSLLFEAGSLTGPAPVHLVRLTPNRLFICQSKSVALFALSFPTYCGWTRGGGKFCVAWLRCHCIGHVPVCHLATVLRLWGLGN